MRERVRGSETDRVRERVRESKRESERERVRETGGWRDGSCQ